MGISATAHSKIFIGTTPYPTGSTATLLLADYSADTYTQIIGISDLGDFGDTASEIKVETIDSGRVLKLNGTRDGGDLSLVANRDATDPGQIAAIAASKLDFNHSYKLVLSDALNPTGVGSTIYFRGLLQSASNKFGGPNNVVQTTFKISINSELLLIAPTAGS